MTAIISKHGELLQTIYANEETIALNTPGDCFAVDDPPAQNMYYENDAWHPLPPAPSPHCVFNYENKIWEDHRTLEDVKHRKWIEIKQHRKAAETGGFLFDGNLYDSDETSQHRILSADKFKVDQIEWTLKNNQVVKLTFEQLTKLQAALVEHISLCHQRARVARQKIDESSTIEELNQVKF